MRWRLVDYPWTSSRQPIGERHMTCIDAGDRRPPGAVAVQQPQQPAMPGGVRVGPHCGYDRYRLIYLELRLRRLVADNLADAGFLAMGPGSGRGLPHTTGDCGTARK